MDIDTVAHITDAILETHHCVARYLQAVQMTYTYKGRVLWEGRVGVFELVDHASAGFCFAWINDELLGLSEPVLVLQSEEVNSPHDAIHAHLTHSPQRMQHS